MKANKYLAYCLSASLVFSAYAPMSVAAEEVTINEDVVFESGEIEKPEEEDTTFFSSGDFSDGESGIQPAAETVENTDGWAALSLEGYENISYKFDSDTKTLQFKSSAADASMPNMRLNKIDDTWAEMLKQVETVVIGENITTVGNYNFANDSGACPAIKTVRLGDAVKVIGDYAFMSVSTLTNVNLEKVTKIGQDGFFKTALTAVNMGADSIELGNRVFGSCASLESFACKNLKDIPNTAFNGCAKLRSFTASGVETIGSSAFSKCAITEFNPADSNIKSIGMRAFYNSTLENIVLNNADMNVLEMNVFQNCKNLKAICYAGTSEQWKAKSSQGRVPSTALVHCKGDAEPEGEVKAPTCTEIGIEEKTCSACKATFKTEVAALGHTYAESKVTKAPTCTETGIEEKTCGTCKQTFEIEIAALDHTYSSYTEIKAATCTEAGIKVRCCTREGCGLIKIRTITALGHDYGDAEYTETKAPTCTEAGTESRPCTREGCTNLDEREIPALGHELTTKVTTEPTCAEEGVLSTVCTRCEHVEKTEPIEATGEHEWSDWKKVSDATVFKAEQQERTCDKCGEKESKAVGNALTPKASVNASSVTLKVKQSTSNLKVTGLAKGDSVKTWKSSNTKVFTVSGKANGTCKLTAKKKGTAKLQITLASGLTRTVTVKVQESTVKTTSISGLSKKITLTKDTKQTLKPVVEPITSQEKVTYATSDKNIVTVNKNGVITAKKAGTAKITVKSGSQKYVVTVTVPKTKTTSITVDDHVTIKKGKTKTLNAERIPSNSDEELTYTSSNKKVVTVDKNGKIKGIKKGTATITVKSGNQKKTVKVTVK